MQQYEKLVEGSVAVTWGIRHYLFFLSVRDLSKSDPIISVITYPSPFKILFTPVSEGGVLNILVSSPSKSCDLDIMPTSLVKECYVYT